MKDVCRFLLTLVIVGLMLWLLHTLDLASRAHGQELPSVLNDPSPIVAVGIVLTAPEQCEVGELVRIDATSSDVDSLTWDILPPTPDFEVINKRAFFSGRKKGEWLVVVAGAKGGQSFLSHMKITVGEKTAGKWKELTNQLEKKTR